MCELYLLGSFLIYVAVGLHRFLNIFVVCFTGTRDWGAMRCKPSHGLILSPSLPHFHVKYLHFNCDVLLLKGFYWWCILILRFNTDDTVTFHIKNVALQLWFTAVKIMLLMLHIIIVTMHITVTFHVKYFALCLDCDAVLLKIMFLLLY